MAPMSPVIQDYLAATYDLTGRGRPVIGARLARHLGVSAPTVADAVQRMRREGFVRLNPHKGDGGSGPGKGGRAFAEGGSPW